MLVKYTFLNTGIDVAKFRMHVHLPSYGTFLSFEKFVKRYNSSPLWTLYQVPVAGPLGTW